MRKGMRFLAPSLTAIAGVILIVGLVTAPSASAKGKPGGGDGCPHRHCVRGHLRPVIAAMVTSMGTPMRTSPAPRGCGRRAAVRRPRRFSGMSPGSARPSRAREPHSLPEPLSRQKPLIAGAPHRIFIVSRRSESSLLPPSR